MSDDESSVDTKVSVYFNSGEIVLLHLFVRRQGTAELSPGRFSSEFDFGANADQGRNAVGICRGRLRPRQGINCALNRHCTLPFITINTDAQ